MSSVARDESRDREMVLRHHPSVSDSGRASVPMWDSSDPERAPPPLPLNPGSSSPATKPNTSGTIAAAAEAFVQRARESAYVTNPSPPKSPEKSLIKGQYHKRMQSMQTSNGSLRERNSYFENVAPLGSLERLSRTSTFDSENRSPTRSPTRSETPTPGGKDFGRDTPSLRPTSRPPPRAILGENTPPSATMLALQNTPVPNEMDNSLADITNGSRPPQAYDAISNQILSLTTIATNLQREMAQLSRRSKDNATDLVSLKEATNSRDEDIRKSLRDLVSNLSTHRFELSPDGGSRATSNYGGPRSLFLDSKAHASPPISKSFSLPRIPSPTSFGAAMEREMSATPINSDGAASIALLEKVLREMATKDGQEQAMNSLAELLERPKVMESDPAISKKLEEVLTILKERGDSQALVRQRNRNASKQDGAPQLVLDFDDPRSLTRISRETSPMPVQGNKDNNVVTEDMRKMLQKMNGSIKEGGGMTAEIKAILRDLRGEVLGMGREIGRKLDQAESTKSSDSRGDASGPGREEIAHIVQEGLDELRNHMEEILREKRRQSSSSSISRNTADGQEVYTAVRNALSEIPFQQLAMQNQQPGIGRDEILEAVREAWETNKPEIEVQNFGLERDEILHCLKEGLQEYRPAEQTKEVGGINYDEVLDAVHEGLSHFKPPPVEVEPSITREDILCTVRECLDSFEFPTSSVGPIREPEITREDVLDAVKEGLSAQQPEIEINRDDLFEAVRAGMEGAPTPMGGVGEQVLDKMEEMIDGMRLEFKQYSAANGGDTEQVLDALKDGLEVLRSNIETYVDRAADVTGKDEIIDTVKNGLEHLRIDLEGTIADAPRGSNGGNNNEVLDAMEREFEHLRQTIATSLLRSGDNADRAADVTGKDEIIDTVKNGLEHLRIDLEGTIADVPRGSDGTNNNELLDAMEKEFEHLRQTIATSLLRSGDNASDKDEILDVLREEISELKNSISKTTTSADSAETVRTIREEFDHIRGTLASTMVLGGASTDKDEMLEAIREGFENVRVNVERRQDRPESVISNTGELIDALNDGLDALRSDVEKMVNKPQDIDMSTIYEIRDTLKEGLVNVRSDIDRLLVAGMEQGEFSSGRGGDVVLADGDRDPIENLRRNDIENLEVMITQLRMKVEAFDNMPPPPPQSSSQPVDGALLKADLDAIEAMLKELYISVTEIAQREHTQQDNGATKDDTEAIETLLRNTKATIDEAMSNEADGLARVTHVEALEATVLDTRDAIRDFGTRLDTHTASKDDLGVLELLVKEMHEKMEEVRGKSTSSEDGERVVKTDLEALELLCIDMKAQLPEAGTIPTREEIESIKVLIKEFSSKVEEESDLTAQAFEARKIEHGGIADKIEDVKGFLDQVREDLKNDITESKVSVEELSKTLDNITETVVSIDATASLQELREVFNREFERMHGTAEDAKLETEQKHENLLEKQGEHRNAVVLEVSDKIDARFGELMIKYDDAQLAAVEKEKAFGEREAEQIQALNATRTAAEEMRLLMDTLGSTMTESCDRLGEDSKTVFNRVDDMGTKLDNLLAFDPSSEHQSTRAEISKTLAGVEGVQAHVHEYHPKILEAVKDVLGIVGQHYEHARTSTEEIKMSVRDIPSAIPLPAITAPSASPPPPIEMPVPEKYDDTKIHTKLDRLVQVTEETSRADAQVVMLGQIQEQVAAQARAFSAFVASQQAKNTESSETTAREAEEAAIALEKRKAQKENVEADIVRLSEQREDLGRDIQGLLQDKDDLLSQKSRLQADLSSIQMALQIRREELHIMEERADGLERRILDGVLDHSRSLLTTSSRPHSSLKDMNLKRVTSTASNATTATKASTVAATIPSATASTVSSGIGMALKRRQPPRRNNGSNIGDRTDRRILSLSTLGANKGPSLERSMVLADPALASNGKGGLNGMKRSHSVKSNFPVRKASWGGTKQLGMYADDGMEEDKENSILDEEDEDVDGSEAGTERRTSYTGTFTGTSMSYDDGSVLSEDDKRTSYVASTIGTLGTKEGTLAAESIMDSASGGESEVEEEQRHDEHGDLGYDHHYGDALAAKGEVSNAGEMIVFGQPSDSGIGTDMPTAAFEGGSDYFKR
ncbi:MAG: hypothetical protein Q9221_007367 [Calogaya cf. arnoldii]